MSTTITAQFVLSQLVVEAVTRVSAELVATLGGDAPDPGLRKVPRDLRLWLARLRLLEGVPFGYLVADSALLPPESIRFFYVDRGWTDALVEGALSVGTVTTADRGMLEQLYGTVRAEVDEAERLVRLPGAEPGAAVPTGPAGPITGFLLRSRMVSGWPGIHVRAYAVDNLRLGTPINDDKVGDAQDVPMQRLSLLRLERLAPAVLLALFDGVPQVVHIEEPRAGIQFGVDETDANGRTQAQVVLRNATTGERLEPHKTVDVPFRRGSPGVLQMRALARGMTSVAAADLGPTLDAAEFALQMLQFPYRAVFADRTLTGAPPVSFLDTFRPRVAFADLRARFAGGAE
jgi:hypothetical protein